MLPISRRRFILGTMSAGLAVRTRIVRANGLSAGTHEIFNLVPSGRFADGTATFANHSFALVLAGGPNRVVTRHDASGALLWRAELGDEEGAIAEPSIVPAVGDALPGFYIASGFKALWRLDIDGSLQWERDLFDHAGMNCQQTMAAHPSGGVVVGGVASRPTEAIEDCANCAIVRLAEDGTPLWTWWRDHAWHAFATAIAVTDQATVIAHMMSYNPATGSQGDHCEGPFHPQWTVWIDPEGHTIRAMPWPTNRRAEGMALDRAGRLVFYGRTVPELHHFFRVCDAEAGTALREHVFGEPEPDDWYLPLPRLLNVSGRGVSVLDTASCHKSESPWGTSIRTLTPDGSVESLHFGGHCGGGQSATMFPDGTAFLVCPGSSGFRIPLP